MTTKPAREAFNLEILGEWFGYVLFSDGTGTFCIDKGDAKAFDEHIEILPDMCPAYDEWFDWVHEPSARLANALAITTGYAIDDESGERHFPYQAPANWAIRWKPERECEPYDM